MKPNCKKEVREIIEWLSKELGTKNFVIKRVYRDEYKDIESCERPFILLIGDAQVEKGDLVTIKEWDDKTKQCTGKYLERRILSVTKVDLKKHFWLKEAIEKGIKIIEV